MAVSVGGSGVEEAVAVMEGCTGVSFGEGGMTMTHAPDTMVMTIVAKIFLGMSILS